MTRISARDLLPMLVEAVRDAAEQLAEAEPPTIARIVAELEQRTYPIFVRIALHLLRVRPDRPPDLARDRLLRKDLFDSLAHRHEYTLLLQARFAALAPGDREQIVGWIDAGPDLERFASNHAHWTGQRPSAEETQSFADHYRLERLWPLRDDLPQLWKDRVASLASRFGAPEHPEFPWFAYSTAAAIEERSPIKIDQLRPMPIEEIVSFVRHWQPTGGFRGPTHEGLRFVIMKLIAEDPQRFASAPQALEELPSPMLLAALDGFREAVKAGRPFSWPEALGFCNRALTRQVDVADPLENRDRPRNESSLPTDAIAALLESALDYHPVPIPFDQRQVVAEILQRLAESRDTSPASDSGALNADRLKAAPFARTTRVKILNAVVACGIWVSRQIADGRHGIALREGLDAIPEVREILNAHVDPARYPAVEVRAFFGHRLLPLLALDAHWVERNLPAILPADDASSNLYQAAWLGYILRNHASLRMFRMLRSHYEAAVDRIQPMTTSNHSHDDPDCQLARHLMKVYCHGEIGWDRDDNLLTRFFTNSHVTLRAEAIRFLGIALVEERSVFTEVLDRLKQLWESRREAAGRQEGNAKELPEFGWWFISGKFDESWAMAQLTDILARAGKAAPEPRIMPWLADVAPRLPREAMRCFELYAEGCDWDFHMLVWEAQIKAILSAALRDSHAEIRQAAADLVDRLGSRGHRQFRSVIQSQAGSQE